MADITYVPTREGFLCLATVLDVFRRKVVGWAMGARQAAALVRSALAFSRRCEQAGVRQSMGARGSCFDNAMAESFFATLECELLQRSSCATREQAACEIFRFLEGFYNRRRRHSALGYLSPADFARRAARN